MEIPVAFPEGARDPISMKNIIFVSVLLATVSASAISTAVQPVFNHLQGEWTARATGETWKFQEGNPMVFSELEDKFLDERGVQQACRVSWQGQVTITPCSEESMKTGFCYNKGRVAKYMLGVSFQNVVLVSHTRNSSKCPALVTQTGVKLIGAPKYSLYPLHVFGHREIWLGQRQYMR